MKIIGEVELRSVAEGVRLPFEGLSGLRPLPIVTGPSSVNLEDFDRDHGIGREFRNSSAYLYRLEDACVLFGGGNDGVVLTPDGKVVVEPSAFSAISRRKSPIFPLDIEDPSSNNRIPRMFLGFESGWTNYFHLLYSIARSALAISAIDRDVTIGFPSYRAAQATGLLRFSEPTLRRLIELALDLERCRFLGPGSYRVGELFILWTEPTDPTDVVEIRETHAIFESLKRRALGFEPSDSGSSLLYVSRERSLDPRLLHPETPRIEALLEKLGFRKVFFEEMSLEDQIRAVAGARAVIGVHGAGLVNFAFARPGTLLIELNMALVGEPGLRPWFYQLACCGGKSYAGFNLDKESPFRHMRDVLPALLGTERIGKVGDAHVRELQTHLAARENELRIEQGEADALRERIAGLEGELAGVYASTSWRLTASLRGASRAMRWFLRRAPLFRSLAPWLERGQFVRAARALLPLYGRYVPLRVKERIPQRLREAVRRRIADKPGWKPVGRVHPPGDRGHSPSRGVEVALDRVPIEQAKALYLKRCELSVFRVRTGAVIAFPREERPYFSVVVCAYNKFSYNIRVLELLEYAANYMKEKIGVGIEVVFIDDGSSDDTANLQNYVHGIVYHRVSPNGGFLKACNLGASLAAGNYLVFLNNDVEFEADLFARLYETVERDKGEISCFGGAILQFDGSIQDLGSGLWRDGVAQGHFRDAPPTRYAFAYPRDVDYVGGCFFCIGAADFRDFGGFDERYSPGYYEETDLCLRLWKSGKRTRVYPDLRVYHLEFGTFSSGTTPRASTSLMARNRGLFARQHQDLLADRPPYTANVGYPVPHEGVRPRLLFIEDQVPSRRLGSGFGRSEIMIRGLLQSVDVEIFSCFYENSHLAPEDFEYIEITYGPDTAVLKRLLSSRHFDTVYVCRPHNLARYESVLRDWKAGGGKIMFDTEAIYAVRETARLDGAESYGEITASPRFRSLSEQEFRPAGLADVFVVVNEFEKAILQKRFAQPVITIGHHLAVRPLEPGPEERSGLLFVGALHGMRSPNYDSLLWFLDTVWPRILAARPQESLRVAGFAGPTVSFDAFRRPGVTCLGAVADLAEEYARARAFVAPTRFAAGLPFKVHEAMSYGLPVVCSNLLYEQLLSAGNAEGVALAATVNDDGSEFSAACLRLLSEDTLWSRQRESGLAYISGSCSPALLSAQIRELMHKLFSELPQPQAAAGVHQESRIAVSD